MKRFLLLAVVQIRTIIQIVPTRTTVQIKRIIIPIKITTIKTIQIKTIAPIRIIAPTKIIVPIKITTATIKTITATIKTITVTITVITIITIITTAVAIRIRIRPTAAVLMGMMTNIKSS